MIGIDLSRDRPDQLAGLLLRIVNYFTERMMKMETQDCLDAIQGAYVNANKFNTAPLASDMQTERLLFTVKMATSEEDLAKAVSIRHRAYARHVPAVAQMLTQAETYDFEKGSVILLAESKLDGSPIGTMRIQTNSNRGLILEQSVELPTWLQGLSLAEATRLGVVEGRIGRLVKTVLFKAYYQFCQLAGIDWMVIAARYPLDRQYVALQFQDVYQDGEYVPMSHAGNIPHRVLAFEVETAQARWAASNHPLLHFMCGIHHPDIMIPESEAIEALSRPIPSNEATLHAQVRQEEVVTMT